MAWPPYKANRVYYKNPTTQHVYSPNCEIEDLMVVHVLLQIDREDDISGDTYLDGMLTMNKF